MGNQIICYKACESQEIEENRLETNNGIKILASKIDLNQQQQGLQNNSANQNDDALEKEFFQIQQTHQKAQLKDFETLKILGKGSFGKVMLVEHKNTKKLYAMKMIQKRIIKTERQKRHTQTERIILEKLDYPFIIQLHYAFQNDDKLYFILDYMNGGELFYHLQRVGRFDQQKAQFYGAEILLAIEHLHQNKIIYRDLKPENCLLDCEGHIRLADFGLSFIEENEENKAKSMCGTPEYLAPEILLSKQGHDKTVDWWSYGALMYEMMTGLPPFYQNNKKIMFQNIITKSIPYPNYLSESAVSLLKQLLVIDPQRRLGYGVEDAQAIKKHEFFNGIDWDKLSERKITPPIKVNVKGPFDLKYFDKNLTQKDVKESVSPFPGEKFENFAFSNFTYNGKQEIRKESSSETYNNEEEQKENQKQQSKNKKYSDQILNHNLNKSSPFSDDQLQIKLIEQDTIIENK